MLLKEFHEISKKAINTYDGKESKNLENYPIYLLRAFIPTTFNAFNYQTRVSSSNDLWKYFDCQQETRLFKYFSLDLMGSILCEELDKIESIAYKYGEIYKLFNRKTNPVGLNQMMASIPSIRAINCLSHQKNKKLNILEIGGGSGMLGHLCNSYGHTHTNFDITQSLFIHNSTVNTLMYKDNFCNYLDFENNNNRELLIDNQKSMNLLPWWHFLDRNLKLPKYDLVVMNHCFMEISSVAIEFILKRIASGQDNRINLLVSAWGARKYTQLDSENLYRLEKKFQFKKEILRSNKKLFRGRTQLLSFQNNISYKKKEKSIIDNLSLHNKKVFKYRSIFDQIFVRKLINLSLKLKNNLKISKKPKILGVTQIQIFKKDKSAPNNLQKNLNLADFINRIKKIENHFKKPICSEDEDFFHFLNL